MSIPIMLAFDLKKVLTLPSSGFLYGNFAHLGAQVQRGDHAFNQLDFTKIYHDAPPATDGDAIREARMSEVVVEQEVSTAYLNAVVCRTVQDLATLKHALADFVPGIPLIVERQSSIFQRRSIYIRELYYDAGCLHFLLTYPHSGGLQGLKLRVVSDVFDRTYTVDTNRFQIECPGADPSTVWAVYIEDCLAYHAPVPWEGGVV